MIAIRLLGSVGWLAIALAAQAESSIDDSTERVAAHFEAASSRLRPEETESLERFVYRARNTPGAKLAVLIPITSEPARARFVAARVNELERRVRSLAETAEYRHVAINANADVLWLALVLMPPGDGEGKSAGVEASVHPVETESLNRPVALTAPAPPPLPVPADLRLNDWVVRGVKRRADGQVSAYVARTVPGALPREVFERQIDRDLGLIREISLSQGSGWVVRSEIGWIGQVSPTAGLDGAK